MIKVKKDKNNNCEFYNEKSKNEQKKLSDFIDMKSFTTWEDYTKNK